MNENLIKGLVKLKLGMIDTMIDRLPKEEAKEVRKLGRVILAAATEYHEHLIKSEKDNTTSGELKHINID